MPPAFPKVSSAARGEGRNQERVLRGAFGTFGGVPLAASKTMPWARDIMFSARSAHRGPFAPGTTGGPDTLDQLAPHPAEHRVELRVHVVPGVARRQRDLVEEA